MFRAFEMPPSRMCAFTRYDLHNSEGEFIRSVDKIGELPKGTILVKRLKSGETIEVDPFAPIVPSRKAIQKAEREAMKRDFADIFG